MQLNLQKVICRKVRSCFLLGVTGFTLCTMPTLASAMNKIDKNPRSLASFPHYACYRAIERASFLTGTPKALLLCIARVESGRLTSQGLHPWPWTVNAEGKSHYFVHQHEAHAYLNRLLDQGAANIDVGCMQLNIKFHHQNFKDLKAMLDPHHNIIYAARFLKRLRRRHGSWAKAVAAYHSRQPKRGQAYMMRVADHLTFKSPSLFESSSQTASYQRPLPHEKDTTNLVSTGYER